MRYDFAIVLVKVPIRADCDPWMRDARSHKLRFRYMRDRDVRAGTNGDGRCNRKAPTIIASFFCSAVLKVISPRDVSELLRRGDLEVIQRSAFDRGIKGGHDSATCVLDVQKRQSSCRPAHRARSLLEMDGEHWGIFVVRKIGCSHATQR